MWAAVWIAALLDQGGASTRLAAAAQELVVDRMLAAGSSHLHVMHSAMQCLLSTGGLTAASRPIALARAGWVSGWLPLGTNCMF